MADIFDQLEAVPPSGGGDIFDQVALQPGIPPVKKAPVAKEEPNVARERLSIGGELLGGLKDFISALPGHLAPPSGSRPEASGPLGLIRAAASPLAPLTNLASGVGENVAQGESIPAKIVQTVTRGLLPPGAREYTPEVAGALSQSIIDVVGPPALSKLSKAAAPVIQRARPLKSEQVAAIRAAGAADEAAITAKAKEATQRAETLRDEQIKQLGEAKKTVPSPEEIAFNKEAQQRQLQELGDKEIEAVRKAAEKELAPSARAAEDVRSIAKDAPTAEEVGKEFIGKTYPTKLAASKKRFNEEYQAVLDEGSKVESPASSYKAASEGLLGEQGTAKVLPTSAEASAVKVSKALDVEDEAYKSARDFFTNSQGVTDESALAQFAQQNKLSVGEASVTADKLILDRQRLKAAERAAYDAGRDSLGRQFKQLRQGIEADLADSGIAEKLSAVDRAYATEHIPFFGPKATTRIAADRSAESIVDRFIPKNTDPNRIEKVTRAFQLLDDPEPVRKAFVNKGIEEASQAKDFGEGLVKWWNKYADEAKTGDKVLKTALGERYVHMQDIITRLRTVKPKEVNKLLSESVAELEKRTGAGVKGIEKAQVDRLKSVEGLLEEGEKFQKTLFERTANKTKLIAKERDEAIARLRKDIERDVSKITGKPFNAERVRGYGMLLMSGGAGAVATGQFALGGLAIAKGGIMLLGGESVAKLLNNTKGLQLFRRAIRTSPGTSQAFATARQIQNFLKELDGSQEGSRER